MNVHRILAASLLLALVWPAQAQEKPARLLLTIDSLTQESAEDRPGRLGFVMGRALAHSGELALFDVVLLVDVSGSTAESSGIDVDGDGEVSRGGFLRASSASGDSILAAEVAAVRSLLATFDPRTTRVALVTFSGSGHPNADDAWVEAPLSADYGELEAALEGVLRTGAEGGTNLYAGLKLAGFEVAGGSLQRSERRRGAERHVVLLTDGLPTLPGPRVRPGRASPQAEDRAIAMSRRLAKRKIRVHSFAIGAEATSRPRAAVEVARISGGTFTAVRDLADLGRLLSEVRLAAIEELAVRNLSNDRAAIAQLHNPDGAYAALVPLREGPNTVEVFARASDGSEKRVQATTVFRPGALSDRQRSDAERLLRLALARERGESRPERGQQLEIETED